MKPVRLRLSRKKGFNLQALSMATNGLPAINVARPSKWGNPFTISFCESWFGLRKERARREAITLFRQWVCHELASGWTDKAPPSDIDELRGKNLACFCRPDQPCHADVLLELANTPPSKAMTFPPHRAMGR